MATTLEEAFLDVSHTLQAHLAEPRSRYLASLAVELGVTSLPSLVEAARHAPAHVPGSAGPVMGFWRDLVKHHALTAPRAEVLARHLSELLTHPAALAFLAEEARPHERAVKLLHDAVRRRFPHYELDAPRIDRATLEALGVPLHRLGVTARFHPNGHLALLASVEARLTLDEQPGRGRFVDRGAVRGGGWAVDQLYAHGCARGECFSPMNDGSAQPTSFLVWVASAAMSVCLAADRASAKTQRRARVAAANARAP